MLARDTYPQDYIDACRARVEAQLRSWKTLAAAKERAGADGSAFGKAFDAFESAFFNNLVIVLESFFVHRTRELEKGDGNPLNEVRILAKSMIQNGEIMMGDGTIKMNPAKSVLKYEIGDKIRLNEADFSLLFEAFFSELESKYSSE
jgi:hypothetical protein